MLPTPPAILATDGIASVIVVTAVPATAVKVGGIAFSPAGQMYVVVV